MLSTNSNLADGRWLLALLVGVVALSFTACQDVGVDGTGRGTPRVRDTVVVTLTRTDTLVLTERIVVTDTIIREVTVRDTVRRIDTIIVRDTIARPAPERRAVLHLKTLSGGFDSVTVDIRDFCRLDVLAEPRRLPTEIGFEAMLPLGRVISPDRFHLAGLQMLHLNVTPRRFRLQPMPLTDDPERDGGGAAVVFRGKRFATGDQVGSYRSVGSFQIRGIDTLRRVMRADLDATFLRERDSLPVILRVVFRMDY